MATPRRNGKLPSCEPCRKSKLRCDHKSPVCDRCIKRDQATQCFYHPAPLTRPTQTNLPAQTQTIHQKLKRRRPDNQLVFRVDKNISLVDVRSHQLSIPTFPEVSPSGKYLSQRIRIPSERQPLKPGVMGIAFPGEILNEQHYDSNLYDDAQRHRSHDTYTISPPVADMERVRSGMDILRELDKIQWFRSVIAIKNKSCPGWFMGPSWTETLCVAIETLYDSTVRNSNDIQSSLLALSWKLFTNTTRRVEINAGMTLLEYSTLIADRWESIGVLFAMLASATLCIADDDEIFTRWNAWKMDRKELRSSSMAISEKCLQHCYMSGLPNDPMCWLVAQQTVLLSHIFGPSGMYCI